MLRSLADEMEAVAVVLENQDMASNEPAVVPAADYGKDPKTVLGIEIEENFGEPVDTRDRVRYGTQASLNRDVLEKMAREDLARGCRVFFGDEEWFG